MKQIYYVLLALSFITSCANDLDISLSGNRETTAVKTDRRTAAEAVRIANSIVAGENNSVTRSSRIASLLAATPIVVSTTRSSADTVMYAVDYGNNQGFALIATDKSLVPVLAVIDEGRYEDILEDRTENYRIALNAAKNYAASKVNPVLPEPNPTIPETWYEYSDTIFPRAKREPNVKIQLDQFWPENIYCHNKLAGCGPVASFQIMSFLESPTNITYTFENKDINNENLNWGILRKHKISKLGITPTQSEIDYHYRSCGLDAEGHKTIGRLIRELGHRAVAEYKDSATGVIYSRMISAIQSISGISPKSRKSGIDNLYSDLCSYPDGVHLSQQSV